MLLLIFISTLSISILSFIGCLLFFIKNIFGKKMIPYLIGFAAGALLSVSFFDLLPEAFELGESLQISTQTILLSTLVGILLFFLLERYVLWFHHHDHLHHQEQNASAILILLGDGFHNFIDGIVIAAAFLTNPAIGITTTLAIAAHEIPQEFADMGVLIHGGMTKWKAALYNFYSGLTAILGALLGYYFFTHTSVLLPYFLAFSGGTFLYIACSDLIPDLHEHYLQKKTWQQIIPFFVGIGLLYFLISTLHG